MGKKAGDELQETEIRLKEFAAVTKKEMSSASFMEIVEDIVHFFQSFIDRWSHLLTKPAQQFDVLSVLLNSETLAVIFAENPLHHAFDIWLKKSATAAMSRPRSARGRRSTKVQPSVTDDQWAEVKEEALESLFALFDSDGSGQVDAEEMRITMGLLGFEIAEDSEQHIHLVSDYDEDGDGSIGFAEFKKLILERMQSVYESFLPSESESQTPPDPNAEVGITNEDLARIWREVKSDEVDLDSIKAMMTTLDKNHGGTISFQEFETLILMKAEPSHDDLFTDANSTRMTMAFFMDEDAISGPGSRSNC